METKTQLSPGNYMKTKKVIEALEHRFCKSTLASIVKKVCPVHTGELDVYYNTADLKNVIEPNLFRDLECEVITHMILSHPKI